MSKSDALSATWQQAFLDAGALSAPTIRGIAAKADISPMAASRLVKGESVSVATVNAVAAAWFGGDRNRVWELHGSSVRDHGDWGLPDEASLLTDEQRKAVVAVMRSMVPQEVRGGGAGVKRSATNKVPAPGPAKQLGNVVHLNADGWRSLADRYLADAEGEVADAIGTLTHDGPEGANATPEVWEAAVKHLVDQLAAERSEAPPTGKAARGSRQKPELDDRRGQQDRDAERGDEPGADD